MKRCHRARGVAAGLLLAVGLAMPAGEAWAQSIDNGFVYQGELVISGTPYSGLLEVQIALYDGPTAPTALATVTPPPTTASAGKFSVELTGLPSGLFNGLVRWVEVRVRPAGASSFTALPRQRLFSVPYAGYALDSARLGGQLPAFYRDAANLTGTLNATVIGNSSLARLNAGAAQSFNSSISVTGNIGASGQFNGSGAGLTNLSVGALNGVIGDGNLPANLVRTNLAQDITANKRFAGARLTFDPVGGITFPAVTGTPTPMVYMFDGGTANAERMVIAHSPGFANWGLRYNDASDKFVFTTSGSPAVTIDLANRRLGIGTNSPSGPFESVGTDGGFVRFDGNHEVVANGGPDGIWGVLNTGVSTGRTEIGGAGGRLIVLNANGAVGIGTNDPGAGFAPGQRFDKFELAGPDVGLRIRNVNDPGGGVLWNSFGTLHLGVYNPGATGNFGQVAPLTRRAFFSMSADGRVGSTTNTGGNPTYRNLLDDGNGNFIVRTNGTLSGNHVALFENTGGVNADGIAIKINNATTNRENNFVTFYDGQGRVAGRIEGFDLQNGDWLPPPPVPNINLRSNISINPTSQWFNPGSLGTFDPGVYPACSLTGTRLPTLSIRFTPPTGFDFDAGTPGVVSCSGGRLPSRTGASLPSIDPTRILNVGTPPIVFTPPTQAELNALYCWGAGLDSADIIDGLLTYPTMAAGIIEATRGCRDDGVTYGSKGADYAEWLPRLEPAEDIRWGQVVGVRNGKVTKDTTVAHQVMVVSRAPIVLGNTPEEGRAHLYEKVAFMGQVPVMVVGGAKAGDYLIPSGRNDGTAVAVDPAKVTVWQTDRVLGRALEASDNATADFVNTLIGVDAKAESKVLRRHEGRLAELGARVASLGEQNRALAGENAALRAELEALKASQAELARAVAEVREATRALSAARAGTQR
jgi:hypothetical protein